MFVLCKTRGCRNAGLEGDPAEGKRWCHAHAPGLCQPLAVLRAASAYKFGEGRGGRSLHALGLGWLHYEKVMGCGRAAAAPCLRPAVLRGCLLQAPPGSSWPHSPQELLWSVVAPSRGWAQWGWARKGLGAGTLHPRGVRVRPAHTGPVRLRGRGNLCVVGAAPRRARGGGRCCSRGGVWLSGYVAGWCRDHASRRCPLPRERHGAVVSPAVPEGGRKQEAASSSSPSSSSPAATPRTTWGCLTPRGGTW